MAITAQNIRRIKEWIQAEVDFNFLALGYSNAFQDNQVLMINQELKQICAHCLLIPRYPLFFKCGHLTCLPCLREYKKLRFTFNINIPCPTCHQSCNKDEIFTYSMEKAQRSDSISMRMFKNSKFICSNAKCKQSFSMNNKYIITRCMNATNVALGVQLHIVNLLINKKLYSITQSNVVIIWYIVVGATHCQM